MRHENALAFSCLAAPAHRMDWLNKLFSKGTSGSKRAGDDPNALWLYVQCSRCGTPLAVRIDRRNEISPDYEAGGMILRKEIMDGVCFQLMQAEIHFDSQGNVTSQEVDRGKMLTREEYESQRGQHS
jgi:hypothetical protein